jgi:hypothetical protein
VQALSTRRLRLQLIGYYIKIVSTNDADYLGKSD